MFEIISNATYFALAAAALWGLFCIAVVWTRVNQKRFKNEAQQDAFLDDVEGMMADGDFDGVQGYCDGDQRALPQVVAMACENRDLGYKKARSFVMDRFQRDVMSDIEYRLNWVSTVIKSAPMIGLFGTVFGMMGAFKTLATAESVEPSALADDINIALRTTACGLAIAIPLMILTQNVNIRIAKMEDLVGAGLAKFMAMFRSVVGEGTASDAPRKRSAAPEVMEAQAVDVQPVEADIVEAQPVPSAGVVEAVAVEAPNRV